MTDVKAMKNRYILVRNHKNNHNGHTSGNDEIERGNGACKSWRSAGRVPLLAAGKSRRGWAGSG